MEYTSNSYSTDGWYGQDIGEEQFPNVPCAAEKIRITPIFFIVSVLTLVTSALLYFTLGKIAAIIPIGLLVAALVLISPRIGIVLILGLQIWDVILNPEKGGGYEGLSPVRILSILCVIFYWLSFFFRPHSLGRSKSAIIFFSCFIIWAMLSISWAHYKVIASWAFVKILIQFSLVYIAVDLLSGKKALEQIFFLMTIGGCTGAFYTLFGGITNVNTSSEHRLGIAGAGTNTLAISIGLMMLAAIALLLLKNKSIPALVISVVALIVMGLTSLKTGTRSVVIGVPLTACFGLFIGYRHKFGKLLLMSILVFALLGGVMYWALQTGFISGDLRERLLGVFGSEMYSSNSRWGIWAESFKIYFANPMGVGAGNENMAFKFAGQGFALESHNSFISVLIEYNFIGLSLFIMAITAMLINVFRIKDNNLRCIAGMIFMFCLFNMMKGTLHGTRLFWQPIMLTMIIIEADFRSRCDNFGNNTIEQQTEPSLESVQQ